MENKEKINDTYAVIKTGGKQYTVKTGDKVLVEKLNGETGDEVTFEDVLLVKEGSSGEVKIGAPVLEDIKVTGRILGFPKNKKVIIFKKKRRKGFKLKKGHRQLHAEVQIESINA